MVNAMETGTYFEEGKIDTEEQTKLCPFPDFGHCAKKYCAWYDDQNNQCAIITLIRK